MRANVRLYPALSPAMTMFFAGTGACKDPGGGYKREKYAIRMSRIAAGKGNLGDSRYCNAKTRPPVSFASFAVSGRVNAGLPTL